MKRMKNVKQRKMMLVLPLLIIPFLTMGFWALGGGKGKRQNNQAVAGLNLDLPDPKQKDDKLLDKLSFYDKADKDSAKMEEWMQRDPYYRKDTQPVFSNELEQLTLNTAEKYGQRLNTSPYDKPTEAPEEKLMAKLKLLQETLNSNVSDTEKKETAIPETEPVITTTAEEDPEMKQLNGTLEKILDIQHPDRVKDRKKPKNKIVQQVESGIDTAVIGFYSFSNTEVPEKDNSIDAVVNQNQTLVDGAVIKLRLLSDIYINNSKIPAGTFVFGTVSLNGERLEIEINSIKYRSSLFDVKMEVYDMDGLPGIYIPGAISRDVAKQGLNDGLSMMDMTSVDPSLKAQAAAAGIGTLKNLLSKKTKLTRVMVKAGYKILLKNKNQNQ
jgi:conjugative transposon TraM protein